MRSETLSFGRLRLAPSQSQGEQSESNEGDRHFGAGYGVSIRWHKSPSPQ
jgi:hypothetical protein